MRLGRQRGVFGGRCVSARVGERSAAGSLQEVEALEGVRVAAEPSEGGAGEDVGHGEQLLGQADPLGRRADVVEHGAHGGGLQRGPDEVRPLAQEGEEVRGGADGVEQQARRQLARRAARDGGGGELDRRRARGALVEEAAADVGGGGSVEQRAEAGGEAAAGGRAGGEEGGEESAVDEGEEGGEEDEGDEEREAERDAEEADRHGDHHGRDEAHGGEGARVLVDEERERRARRGLDLPRGGAYYRGEENRWLCGHRQPARFACKLREGRPGSRWDRLPSLRQNRS